MRVNCTFDWLLIRAVQTREPRVSGGAAISSSVVGHPALANRSSGSSSVTGYGASSEVDAEEAEMLREIEELERERDMLMQLRALEEENEQLRKYKRDKASKAEAERREAQAAAEAKAAAEARATAEAKAAADAVPAPLDNSATSKLLNRSVSLRTPEEKAAALEELKATARARVRAEVDAKLADLRARNILSADVETTA